MFYVAIIGCDGADSYETFSKKCIFFLRERAKEGITILATGEHEYIKRFTYEYRINVQYFYTDWKAYGRDALKERNKELISSCNGIISFNDGRKDTDMIVSMARKAGVPTRVIKKDAPK